MADRNIGNALTGATLLTLEQAEGLPKDMLKAGKRWWLKTPGYTNSTITCVFEEGTIDGLGSNVERYTTAYARCSS